MAESIDNSVVIFKISHEGEDSRDELDEITTQVFPSGVFNYSQEIDDRTHSHEKKNMPKYTWILIASIIAAIGGLLFGYDCGIISFARVQIAKEFSLDCQQQEFVVISLALGALVASFFSGILVDYIGRKSSIIINCFIFLVGSVLLGVAKSYAIVIIGRFIVGFGVGLAVIVDGVYISEIAPEAWRGALVTLHETSITVGFLLSYIVGYMTIDTDLSWRTMFLLPLIFIIIQLIGILVPPESPRFLIYQGKYDEARQSLAKLTGGESYSKQFDAIKENVELERDVTFCNLFSAAGNMRWRLVLAISLAIMTQACGQMNVLYYAPTIFSMLGFQSENVIYYACIILGAIKVVFVGITIGLIDKIGRRKLLIFGTLLMTIMIIMSSGFLSQLDMQHLDSDTCEGPFQLPSSEITTSNTTISTYKIFVVVGFILYIAGYSLSFGPVMWVLLSELFPMRLKGRAICIALIFMWIFQILVSGTFLDLYGKLGWQTFLLYGILCFFFNIFIILFIPETKGKSLEQVSMMFKNSSSIFMGIENWCQTGEYINLDES